MIDFSSSQLGVPVDYCIVIASAIVLAWEFPPPHFSLHLFLPKARCASILHWQPKGASQDTSLCPDNLLLSNLALYIFCLIKACCKSLKGYLTYSSYTGTQLVERKPDFDVR